MNLQYDLAAWMIVIFDHLVRAPCLGQRHHRADLGADDLLRVQKLSALGEKLCSDIRLDERDAHTFLLGDLPVFVGKRFGGRDQRTTGLQHIERRRVSRPTRSITTSTSASIFLKGSAR